MRAGSEIKESLECHNSDNDVLVVAEYASPAVFTKK